MDVSQDTGIHIKGIREGILLSVEDHRGSFEEILQRLQQELKEKRAFLKGSRIVLDLGARAVQREQLAEIQLLLEENEMELWTVLAEAPATRESARSLGLATRLSGSNTDLEGNELGSADTLSVSQAEHDDFSEANALLLLETVRSGRSIHHDGHVTIVGDVNPGAQVIAAGHVVVWGRLRGLVHAGAQGDASAVICALRLTPTQLRIANHIAIPPEESDGGMSFPEMASVRDGQIVADPWRVKDRD